MVESPFRLSRKTPFGIGESVVEWATGLSKLDSLYKQEPLPEDSHSFMHEALARLVLNIEFNMAA